jgi:hypothetical protein
MADPDNVSIRRVQACGGRLQVRVKRRTFGASASYLRPDGFSLLLSSSSV